MKQSVGAPDFPHYQYVIDAEDTRHLEGVVSLREFAVADDGEVMQGLMNASVNTVDALEPAGEAARRVANST